MTEQEYVCEYQFEGKKWGTYVHARSSEEASRKLRAIGTTGEVKGVLMARVPVPGGRLFERVLRWLRGEGSAP